MLLLVTHAIYIIIIFTVVQSYITSTSLHPGLSRAKSNGTRRCSAVRRHWSPRSPDVVLGERVLRMLISCPECHRIPLTRSVFMFGTIEDTPSIIRTRCKSDLINDIMGYMRIFGNEPSSVIFSQTNYCKKFKSQSQEGNRNVKPKWMVW